MMRSKVLVINLGWEQEPLLDRLNERDVDLYGVHYNHHFYNRPDFKDVLVCDLRDLEKILAYAKRIQPNAVISDQCDYSYFAQAVVAEAFRLPGPAVKQAQLATNKYLQRIESRKHGLPIPEFRLCSSFEEARVSCNSIGFPVVLKPLDNRGSFGVNRVDTKDQLENAFWDAMVHCHSRQVLVEEFIEGTHITVDGYVFPDRGCRSLAVASKLMLGSERQVAVDIMYPAEIPSEIYDRALSLNEEVNSALGFSFGMTHSEYMINASGEIFLIETANRGGGVYTSEIIVPRVSGIDVVEQLIDDSLGVATDRSHNRAIQNNQVLLKFLTFSPGKIRSIHGLAALRNDTQVLKVRLAVDEGDIISPVTTDADRHGFVIIAGDGDIRKQTDCTLQTLEITYER